MRPAAFRNHSLIRSHWRLENSLCPALFYKLGGKGRMDYGMRESERQIVFFFND